MEDNELLSPLENRLQQRIAALEQRLEELLLQKRRNQIIMSFTNITTFDYDMRTGSITTDPSDFTDFGMPPVLTNGPEDILNSGIIAERSKPAFRELYAKIDSGEPSASATIATMDINGEERFLELDLVTIFDKAGKPLRAVGIHKDITESMLLQNEKQYADALASLRSFTYEANITADHVIRYDKEWAQALGLTRFDSFSAMVENVLSQGFLHPDHLATLREILSREHILEAFQNGRRLLTFEYLKSHQGRGYQWYEQSINIIRDRLAGDITVRAYVVNVNERKQKELHAMEEQRYYEIMRAKSVIICESNITKNICISGCEEFSRSYNFANTDSYIHLINSMTELVVHPEDRDRFVQCFARDSVLHTRESGVGEILCDFRVLSEGGDYVWVRCTMHLFEDPQTSDLRAFAYIESINNEKLRELDLLYKAQHDMLTGFYDKATAQEMINDYLASPEGISGRHALFMIDIDHFKSVNDTFGHAFGDSTLVRTTEKLRALFRKSDVLCRVGGDEFIVLMKHVPTYKTALQKAQEMCDSVSDVYTLEGVDYRLYISVGVAYFDKHGKNYEELYNCADNALYYAKEHGRNRFAVYHPNIRENITNLKKPDSRLLFQNKTFSTGIGEQVFRALYEAADKDAAITLALETIGKQYHVSRAYIFENSEDGSFTSNTYEWCNKGTTPQKDNLQAISYSELGEYFRNFNEEGVFFLPDISKTGGLTHTILERQNIKSLVQVSILQGERFVGFVGFDKCIQGSIPTLNELWDYRSVANILGVFLLKMRCKEENQALRETTVSIVNGLNSYAYICDPETHRLLFINENALALTPGAQVGNYCYRTLWGMSAPCPTCPMRELENELKKSNALDMYNFDLNMWLRSTVSWVEWLEGRKVCLIECVDITKYKQDWSL